MDREEQPSRRRFLLLPTEDAAAFDALRKHWFAQYKDSLQKHPGSIGLIETLVEREWQQQRSTLRVCMLDTQLAEAEQAGNVEAIEAIEKRLTNAHRVQTSAEKSFTRALQAVEQFRTTRVKEARTFDRLDIMEFRAFEHALCSRARVGMEVEIREYRPQEPEDAEAQGTEFPWPYDE